MFRVTPAATSNPAAARRVGALGCLQQRCMPRTAGSLVPRCRTRARAVQVPAQRYDYIIVGGGTAGCVLANRLSADAAKRVLVLEAGGDGGQIVSTVPMGLTRLFQHPTLDWNLFSKRQQQLTDKEVYVARGKGLGGSSATNATLYLRGTPSDYDGWGLDGWGASHVLPWFVEGETNSKGASKYHGASGSMKVESPRYHNELHDAFFTAAQAAGLEANPDFNNWDRPQAGYGEYQVTQWKARRADAYKTHLKEAQSRPNLTVVTNARATRLATECSSAGARAVGVEYAQVTRGPAGMCQTAELAPGGEVLLCSGSVANPQLLMLSGIGPKQQLAAAGIPVVVDSQGVGQNLQDHPATLWAAPLKAEFDHIAVTSQALTDVGRVKLSAILQWLLFSSGPLATTGCDRGAFVNTRGGSGEPDLQIRFVPGYALDPDAIKSYIKIGQLRETRQKWPAGITMQLLACRPKCKGSVGLNSTNPFDPAKIDLGYFTDDGSDLATLVAGIKVARNIAAQSPLGRYIVEEGWPGDAVQSQADLEHYVRTSACSGNALTGTCRMGARPTDGSVVSSADFSLWGVGALRVIDASVVPHIPSGQTGAVTFMLAERAAALLAKGTPIAPATAVQALDTEAVCAA